MGFTRPRALRRRLVVLLLALVTVIGAEAALPAWRLAPGTATAVADRGTTYDQSLRPRECSLLGRAYAAGLGCAREQCVPGAVLWRRTLGAEACALPGQPQGYGYASTVGVRDCQRLHRRWIPAVNYCASQPDRSLIVSRDAPQCTGPASVYVALAEREGRYDECLTSADADALARVAVARGTTLTDQVARRQRLARPSVGGPLLIGDSVSWRGSDELARRLPQLTVDGEPARRPTELAARLAAFRHRHGEPSALIVELGTNPAPGFDRSDLVAALRGLPAATPVMLVLPYVETGTDPVVVSSWTGRFDGWMRSVAAARPHTCLADWPAYAAARPGLLQDGTHVQNALEDDWARWLVVQWERCEDRP
jgi:hypothetical protein